MLDLALSLAPPSHLSGDAPPRRVQIVQALPRTAPGKVPKHALREQAREKVAQPAD